MPIAKIKLLDEVNCVIVGLRPDHLTYFWEEFARSAPNYFFNPKYKLGQWDGKIRYFQKTGKTFVFLLDEIVPKLNGLGYDIKLEDNRSANVPEIEPIDDSFFSHIFHPDFDEYITLRDYQVDAVNTVLQDPGIIIAGTGAGKAQPLYSKILTVNGWKKMGDIQVGDVLYNPCGGTTNVIGVYPQPHKKPVYELTFHDGSKTRACDEHLWDAFVPKQLHKAWTERKTITTKDIVNFYERKNGPLHTPGNISIPLTAPVEYPKADVPLDPYVLGLLIGDGCLKNTPTFSTADQELISSLREGLQLSGIQNVEPVYTGYGYDYRLSKIEESKNRYVTNNLAAVLKDLGLYATDSYTKHIPDIYKTGSCEQRLSILQGLLDTDGTADTRGNVSFSTSSPTLATDVQQLCWSLGMTCTRTIKTTNIQTKSYTLFIRAKVPSTLFRLERKRLRCRDAHADGRVELTRRIKHVEFIGYEDTQCIAVDSAQHLYITDDYIVTHNTLMCAALCTLYGNAGFKTLTIVPSKDLIEQTYKEYVVCELDAGRYYSEAKELKCQHLVSTWQSLKNNPTLMEHFDMVIVDECHGAKGQQLQKLLIEHGGHIALRFGLTGTLPKAETDAMAVRICLGKVKYTIPAKELIDRGVLASLDINILQLEEDFDEEYKQHLKELENEPSFKKPTLTQFKDSYFPDYTAEKRYLQSANERLEWIADYISVKRDEQRGNVFCLVDGVRFGKKLADNIEGAVFVHGKDKQKARQEIYNLFKTNDNLVVIATIHIASTGLNINRIFNMMFIDVGKSFIRVIQTIGRGLRKAKDKDSVLVTDICSDLKYSKRHLAERVKFYKEAQYPHKKTKIRYSDVNI
jgi:superfamily II DNA or RNA helicase